MLAGSAFPQLAAYTNGPVPPHADEFSNCNPIRNTHCAKDLLLTMASPRFEKPLVRSCAEAWKIGSRARRKGIWLTGSEPKFAGSAHQASEGTLSAPRRHSDVPSECKTRRNDCAVLASPW